MKLILFVFICSFLILVACNRKTSPSVSPVTTADNPVPPVNSSTGSSGQSIGGVTPALVTPVTGSAADMEAGRVIYTTKCIKCHDAKPLEKWTQAEWQPILKSMIRKTKLDSLENMQVRLYVNTHARKG
ncbi:MAG: hypothetical protein ABWZ25_07920 [Chitinophagaceae bacterium]